MTKEKVSLTDHLKKASQVAQARRKENQELAAKYRAIAKEMQEISRIAKARKITEEEVLRILLSKLTGE